MSMYCEVSWQVAGATISISVTRKIGVVFVYLDNVDVVMVT